MQFTDLMLIYTPATFWNVPPENAPLKASGLRDLLLYLLDPNKPGLGALNSYASSNQDEPNWLLDGKTATDWVLTTYNMVWKPQAEALSEARVTASQVVEEHLKYRAELFFDRERLVAVLESVDVRGNIPDDIFISLSVDWVCDDQWLWWIPQLRICNYWPHKSLYAPPPPPGATAQSSSLPLEKAADILYEDFWHTVETAFKELYLKYLERIGVTLELTPELVISPVFFYAKPDLALGAPEDFVLPQHLSALQNLAKRITGTEDLLSTEVAGALLRGTILTFRRELEIRLTDENTRLRTSWRSYYLLIPWLPAQTTERAEEAEHEACLVARRLAYCEFIAGGQRHMDLDKDLLKPIRSLRLLTDTAEEAVRLVKGLQRQVAFESKSRVRHDAYEVVRQLHSAVFRLGVDLLPTTNKIISRKADWQHIADSVIGDTQYRLAIRALPSIRPLLEALARSRAHMKVTSLLEKWAQEVPDIQNNFRSVTASLQDILEQERREIGDREQERQRLLSYVLAVLAAVAVFPLLIGQASWTELSGGIGAWPDYIKWFGNVYIDHHNLLTLLAMISATVLIAVLLIALIRMTRRWGGFPDYCKELAKADKEIDEVERLIKEQKDDIQICQRLLQVVGWTELESSDPSHPPDSGYKAISDQVTAFIIHIELLTRLPIPKRLPRALCLCRYYDLVESIDNAAQTEEDFSKALKDCGLGPEEVKQTKKRAEEYRRQKDWQGLTDWILGDSFITLNGVGNQHTESPRQPPTAPLFPSASAPSVPVSGESNKIPASAKQD